MALGWNRVALLGLPLLVGSDAAFASKKIEMNHQLIADGYWYDGDSISADVLAQGYYQLSASGEHDRWFWGVSGFAVGGDSLSPVLGDSQGASNIDANDTARVSQLTLGFVYEDWTITVGREDENSLFATVDTASDFINSSMGYSPTLTHFVSYPESGWMLAAQHEINDQWRWQVAVFDEPGGDIFEKSHANVELIYQPFKHASAKVGVSDSEPYLVLEQGGFNAGGFNWATFFQAGYNRAQLVAFESHLGAGVTASTKLNDDPLKLGIGISQVETDTGNDEVALELFAKYWLGKHLSIQPDIQFISSDKATVNDAFERHDLFAFTLRMSVNW